MKDFSGLALETAHKQMQVSAPLVRLLSLTLPTPTPSVLRLANYDRDIDYGTTSTGAAITWSRFPFSMGELRDNRQGDLANLSVNICNVTHELMAWIDGYDGLVGQSVEILQVNTANLADHAITLFAGDVTGCDVNQKVAIFSIGSPKLARQKFPALRWLTSCGVIRFGDADCGYVIPSSPTNSVGFGFDYCPRSLEACSLRGDDEEARGVTRLHPRRFAGAPGIKPGNP